MRESRLFPSRRRVFVVLVSAALVWASIAAVASAAGDKTFLATFDDPALIAGASYGEGRNPILLTIRNTSSTAALGSANVTLPAGVLLTGASVSPTGDATPVGQVLELRNLNLGAGSSAQVYVSAQVECGSNHLGYAWTIQAKQANDFNGTPGNDLVGNNPETSISENCVLIFSHQPAHSERLAVITDKIYDSDPNHSNPVTVAVRTSDGLETVSWWSGEMALVKGNDPTLGDIAVLTGTSPSFVGSGYFEFKPTLNISASGYTVVANATPTDTASQGTQASVTSAAFNIVDDAFICEAAVACSATAGVGQKTEAKVQASANGAAGDLVILAINPLDDPLYNVLNSSSVCNGYVATSDIIVFNVADFTGAGTSTRSKITNLKLLAQYVNKSASKYQVCYDDSSGPILLQTCAAKNPVPPCVISKALDKSKNLVIVVSSPGGTGDPGLKF